MPPLHPAARLLATASCVGVSGSRTPGPACVQALRWALGQVRPSASVVTGCAAGIDAAARGAFPAGRPAGPARVFRASAFSGGAAAPWALAARSTAAVQAVAAAGAGALWVSVPGCPCPAGLRPSRSPSACFSGTGSGSWASLALALGLGVRCLVWLPAGVPPLAGWGLQPLARGPGGAWFRSAPAPAQGALF